MNTNLSSVSTAVDKSEVEMELDQLANSIENLTIKQQQLSLRLKPVCRGYPPKTESGKPSRVANSPLASSILSARERIDAISTAIDTEIGSLAI